MRIRISAGPDGTPQHQSNHYVYDVRTGLIIATYHFVGAPPESDPERQMKMLESAYQASGIPVEHLAILICLDIPSGEGELHVDHNKNQLVRKCGKYNPRVCT